MQVRVFGEQLHDGAVGGENILRITRKRHPAKGSLALAKQRTDVGWHKAGEIERVRHAVVVGLLADVVAVVEHLRAGALEGQHCLHVSRHRVHRHLFIFFRIGLPQLVRRDHRQPGWDVHQRLMRRRLVCHHVRDDSPRGQFRVHVRGVADQPDGARRLILHRLLDQRHRLFEIVHHHVHETDGATALGAFGVHFHDESHTLVHGDRKRLRAAHPAETRCQHKLAFQRSPAFEFGQRAEGLVRALQNPLRADVDPRTGRHLAVHDQSFFREFIEMFPRCPMWDEVRVGDQHARRVTMRLEHRHRLARLDEQGFILLQIFQRLKNRVERFPVARGLSAPAVDDQVLRTFGHLRVEVVLDHAVGGFGEPVLAGEGIAPWGANSSRSRHDAAPCSRLPKSWRLRKSG